MKDWAIINISVDIEMHEFIYDSLVYGKGLTKKEAIDIGRQLASSKVIDYPFHIARRIENDVIDELDAESILTDLHQNDWSDVNDKIFSCDTKQVDELEKKLQKTIRNWAKKNNIEHTWFNYINYELIDKVKK